MKTIKNEKIINRGEIIIYKPQKEVKIEVKLDNETIWLNQAQISSLFQVERSVITKHLKNIFKGGELNEKSNVQKMHITNSDKPVSFYNLDCILSVGYRVSSKKATEFRIWATKVLRNHLIQGYTVNAKRLAEANDKFNQLKNTISFLNNKISAKSLKGQEKEIVNLLNNYAKTLTILEQYDKGTIKTSKTKKAKFKIDYRTCSKIVSELKRELIIKKEAAQIFGNERDKALESIVKNLYQTFGRQELYGTIEEKSSHLLYLIIKDHPFSDGNKRIGSFLFVYFLDKNNYLYRENGEKKINDNALAALALLIAESNPKEKEQMIALITQLLK
jgi:prophage maintenance system killer protein